MWVHALRDADASCGGKAIGLARLVTAGLPVPDGFVIDDRAFRAVAGTIDPMHDTLGHELEVAADRVRTLDIPDDLVREVDARARVLGAPFAVRSSASIEDGEAGAAAGVFSSREAVELGDLWSAIRTVWESALTPLAAAYARGRPISIGVIVQRHIAGVPIHVYTRPPGSPHRDEVWIQEAGTLVHHDRASVDPIVLLALRAETAIAATTGADVELVGDHVVQARPIIHPVAIRRVPPPPIVLAALVGDGRRWTWDAAHNPDPLSIAQGELVELVDRAGVAPWVMRVCGGYLYTAPRTATRRAGTIDLGDLEAEMADVLGDDVPSVDDAIARYIEFYRLWSELSGIVARQGGPRRSIVHATLSRGLSEAEVIA
ncbi:MAG TPA: PEP/pyruvate-binding domain-containing protein, partial [Kofleriaceae bacterium]|nr:PEP/pyruvate-binding domain-containing protein [Kofleriaceae bacterium]